MGYSAGIAKARSLPLGSGIALTLVIALLALALARLPGLHVFGPLSVALLLGMAWNAWRNVTPTQSAGVAFSARTLLRLGIVLLGVRLNFDLLLHAGLKIVALDLTVVTVGMLGIIWLGRRFGLDPALAGLIAAGSSICGSSAIAAAAPVLRAKEEEVALVIPLCSLLGGAVMLVLTLVQQWHPIDPVRYGLFSGAVLHEVAQVMAAVAPVPEAAEIATVTKLMRVVLLVPVLFLLSSWMARRGRADLAVAHLPVKKPWFVLGFFLVAVLNAAAFRWLPAQHAWLLEIDGALLTIATLLMAMAMAAMGLQVNFAQFRANGRRSLATALVGWAGLATLAAAEVALFTAV